MKLNILAASVAAALSMVALSAHATNGYFSHGYGMKAKGMAGASTATADDTFGGATNPAKMAFVGNRLDLGADMFNPNREMSRSGVDAILGTPAIDGTSDSEDKYFLIPEFGYNRMINPNLAVGVSVYGNGGMNTDYNEITFNCGAGARNALCGIGDLGVDLSQLIIAPTVAYKINEQHAVGISPLFAYQRFAATGLHAFTVLSSSAGNVTNNGYDSSTGWGVRIGWMGKLTDKLSLGAAYASKMDMDKFDKYSGLFAEQGDFDIPMNWNVGMAFQATPQIKLVLDYQHIDYSGVSSIHNPSTNAAQLGAANGPGFGWQDVDVWKLGVEYAYSKNLTLRAGWNHGDNPIQARDVTFNILAPGVVRDHLTLGVSYTTPSGGEWTMAFMHAFENDVSGSSLLPPMFTGNVLPPGGVETIKMNQNSLGIAYSWKM